MAQVRAAVAGIAIAVAKRAAVSLESMGKILMNACGIEGWSIPTPVYLLALDGLGYRGLGCSRFGQLPHLQVKVNG